MTTGTELAPIDAFRALVMADPALQQLLAEQIDPAKVTALALEVAARHGIVLDAEVLNAANRPDPLGLNRFAAAPLGGAEWPPLAWLPVRCSQPWEEGWIDWGHFAGARLDRPFYEDEIRRAANRPFNSMFRYRTPIEGFVDNAELDASLKPAGFIFHMSRCGSTLVSQMLAAVPEHIMASEPAPLDAMLMRIHHDPHFAATRGDASVRAALAALGRNRDGAARHFFVKPDCWHIFSLPLIRRLYPDVPWVFLFRDPVEVLVSQMRVRGVQTVPGVIAPSVFGMEMEDGVPVEDYVARVLAKTCQAALDHWHSGGGIAVDYRELPHAVESRILPHFGIEPDDTMRARMTAASGRNAKAPDAAFTGDSAGKQREATPAVREAAETHFAGIYARLRELAAG